MTIQEKELFGLLGVNGAGKTTLIKMLSGLIIPSSGEAFLLGNSIQKNLKQIKKIIAVSPQETAIAPNLTVRENIELLASLYGFSKDKIKYVTNNIIKRFSLKPFEHQRSKLLSGGWQRKLSIAMALISEPEILFLDEPTLGLDVISRRELWKLIKELNEYTTIILTTHYLEEAEELSNRVCIMKEGAVKAIGSPRELVEKANVTNFEDAFVHFVGEGKNS